MADFLEPAANLREVGERFVQFARIDCGRYPLYERLAVAVSTDDDLLRIASHARVEQPIPPLFLAAAHYLLLGEPSHPLARFYRNLQPEAWADAARGAEDPFVDFRAFVLERGDAMTELMRHRAVQTNEVARCACLLPVLACFQADGPLAWIEAGTSAGLNLNWPLYRYEYSDGRVLDSSPGAAAIDGRVRIPCELRGQPTPLPARLPRLGEDVAMRVGIDLRVIRADRADEGRWLQALVWPDQIERFSRLRAALSLQRDHPVHLIEGSVLDVLPDVVSEVDPAWHVCLVHSYMMHLLSPPLREEWEQQICMLSRSRRVTRIYLEWLDRKAFPILELHEYRDGRHVQAQVLGTCHWHGEWIDWRRPCVS